MTGANAPLPISTISSLWHKKDPLIDPARNCFSRLPTELILYIFDDLYLGARTTKVCRECIGDEGHKTSPCWKEVEDFGKLDFFPFNVAASCSAWFSCAMAFPQYWTRLVLLVGRDFTPLWAVLDLLEASGSLDIEVIITRRDDDFDADDLDEQWRVSAVLKLIRPHLHRITYLQVNVAHPESLNAFKGVLRGEATKLVKLELTAPEGALAGPRSIQPLTTVNALNLPALEDLTIDTWNFFQLFIHQSSEGGLSSLRSLLLWSPEAADPHEYTLFSARDLIEVARRLSRDHGYLDSLELDQVHFEPSEVSDYRSFNIADLTFTRLAPEVPHQITAHLDREEPDRITFRQCELIPYIINVGSTYFNLYDIPAGDPWDLIGFLQQLYARHLVIAHCPGLTDDVLVELEGKGEDFVPSIQELVIRDCPNVTSRGVRRMIEARLAVHIANKWPGDWEMMYHPVTMPEKMCLRRCGKIEDEDIAWLKSHSLISEFDWSP